MALPRIIGWEYFGSDEAAGLTALRAALGPSWASAPTDAVLLPVLTRVVSLLHDATHRVFVTTNGTIEVSGTRDVRLPLHHSIVSTQQGGTGVTAVVVDGTSADLDSILINDGIAHGPDDPRRNPFLEWKGGGWGGCRWSVWPYGVQNIAITGSFGFVEADGSTPPEILHVIGRLVALNTYPGDTGNVQDKTMEGEALGRALIAESAADHSYTYSDAALSYGLTLDRQVDLTLRRYSARAGIRARISRGTRRRRRRSYHSEPW